MHANCAFCRRPDGDFSPLDLRYDIPLQQMNICNVAPQKGDVGVPISTDLTPGKPMESVIWLRMNALGCNGRMPQIGAYHVDMVGVALIGEWITSIAACPWAHRGAKAPRRVIVCALTMGEAVHR